MEFDPLSAVPVKERPDGLLEEDVFDPTTARPIDGSSISEAEEAQWFNPPLTESQRAQAVVETVYKEQGKKVPLALKFDWMLSSPKAQAVTQAATWTILTRGLFPIVQIAKGAAESNTGLGLEARAAKGFFYPEYTKDLSEKIPGYDKFPKWAKILTSVTESIASYLLVGAVKAGDRKSVV